MNPILPLEQLSLVFVLVAGLVGWSGWRSAQRLRGGLRGILLGLRWAALAALAVIALNPGHWQVSRSEAGREWAVLLDSSVSMDTADVEGGTRWTHACGIAQRLRAPEGQTLRFFTFAAGAQPVPAPAKLEAEACRGEQTDIVGALAQVAERYRSSGQHLGGIVVLSDGRQVPARGYEEVAMELRAGRSPVYPVVLGEAVKTVDLAIGTRRPQYIAFAGQSFTVDARLRCTGLANIRPRVSLLDGDGKVLAEKPVFIGTQAEVSVAFEINAAEPGYRTYRLRVEHWAGEGATTNNTAEFAAYVLGERMRVLLVEGAPHWDSKFIAQLLQGQRHVDLSLVYRLGQERYFSQMDSSLLSAEQAWRELPESVEALARYDLIVAGRGFEYFLNRGSIGALKEFLRVRGGGLVFTRGKAYAGEQPELEALEPVSWGPEWNQRFVWQPTDAGEEAGLFSDGLPGRSDPLWAKLPQLSHAWQTTRPKLFARVLAEGVAEVGGRSVRVPVLVAQRFGKGQVVAVNSEDLWQWDFFPKVEGASAVYRDFWLHLITWAAVQAEFLPGHDWALHLSEPRVEVGQPVRLRMASRLPEPVGAPVVRIWRGAKLVGEVALAAVPERSGEYEGVYSPTLPGLHRLEAAVGTAPLVYETLAVQAPPAESDDVSPDREWLAQLAAATQGRLVTEEEIQGLFAPPPATAEALALDNARWVSRWDRAPWLLLVVALLASEWVIRRRNGLT
jgi:hypothetical protein